MLDVKFNQPIFGANNLTVRSHTSYRWMMREMDLHCTWIDHAVVDGQGKCQPVNCLGVVEPIEWKVRKVERALARLIVSNVSLI